MKLLMELGLKSVVAPPRHHDVNARGHEQVNNNNTLYSAVCLYYLKKKKKIPASNSGGAAQGTSTTTTTIIQTQQQPSTQSTILSTNLQQRLARVSEQFSGPTTGTKHALKNRTGFQFHEKKNPYAK